MGPRRAPLIVLLACAILAVTRPAGSTRPVRALLSSAPACSSGCTNVLGSASRFFVLGGSSVTGKGFNNVPNYPLNIGVSPGKTITGFGATYFALHANDAVAKTAHTDAQQAYKTLYAMQSPIGHIGALLGNYGSRQSTVTMKAGVYDVDSAAQGAGSFSLDGQNKPSGLFVFKFSGAFTANPGFNMYLINGAQACNVFILVGGSASVSSSSMVGTILAAGGITFQPSTLQGSLIALSGAVNMQLTTISGAGPCVMPPPSPPPPAPICNGYTFMMGVDSYGPSLEDTVSGGAAAASDCSQNAQCLSFDTDYRGASSLRASSAYKANSNAGLFTKTCDTITQGYASLTGWNWGGPMISYQDIASGDLRSCQYYCNANYKCDVFVFDSVRMQCSWQTKPSSGMLAGKKVATSIVSYWKLSSLPGGWVL